jgi:hypothetical protein
MIFYRASTSVSDLAFSMAEPLMANCNRLRNIQNECWNEDGAHDVHSRERNLKEGMMSRTRTQSIRFDRRGGVLFYRGASGKTVDHIRLSQADHTIFVVVAFADRTEWSVTLNSIPVATVSLYVPGDGNLGDLEPIAESGYTLLPESGHIEWSQIKQPPKQRKTRDRVT